MTHGISPELTGMAIDVAVAKKQKDMIEQQGENAVALIEAAAPPPPPSAGGGSHPGVGRLIDTYM